MVCYLGSNYHASVRQMTLGGFKNAFSSSPFVELNCHPKFILFENHSMFLTKELNLFFSKWKPLCDREIEYC